MSNNKDADVLFDFLQSMLLTTKPNEIDIKNLSDDFKNLGESMNMLSRNISELYSSIQAIAKGNFDFKQPNKDNILCYPIKELRSNLLHLTWQTQQVARGDYKQKVDFLGAFSTAFNKMISQLNQREIDLKSNHDKLYQKALALEESNALMTCITDNIDELIFVIDSNTGNILFENNSAIKLWQYDAEVYKQIIINVLDYHIKERYWKIEIDNDEKIIFMVNSFFIDWNGKMAFAHMIKDITKEFEYQKEMESYAYTDTNTGLYNRRYCMKILEEFLKTENTFSLVFIDLNGLKYVNDNFGHNKGDEYIRNVADTLKDVFRSDDIISRIGGDEFVVILKNCNEKFAEIRLKNVSDRLNYINKFNDYHMSLSYGIASYDKSFNSQITAKQLLDNADKKMYIYKKAYHLDRDNLIK